MIEGLLLMIVIMLAGFGVLCPLFFFWGDDLNKREKKNNKLINFKN